MSRILVIEDDAIVRELLQDILAHAGYEVVGARDGKEGIRLYRNEPADLVITDLIMPEKEGIETIMELRRDFPHLKSIAISGGGHISPSTYLEIAKQFGVQRTFAKPFLPDEILEAVRELVGP